MSSGSGIPAFRIGGSAGHSPADLASISLLGAVHRGKRRGADHCVPIRVDDQDIGIVVCRQEPNRSTGPKCDGYGFCTVGSSCPVACGCRRSATRYGIQ